ASAGNSSFWHLISWRHRTSGLAVLRKSSTSGRRSRTELMFQVVIERVISDCSSVQRCADLGNFRRREQQKATLEHKRCPLLHRGSVPSVFACGPRGRGSRRRSGRG